MLTRRSILLLFLLLFSVRNLVTGQTRPDAPRIAESSLRKAAKKLVMPEYPEESVRQRSKGVAVAEIVYDEAGVVIYVEVLEAPDKPIKDAVSSAVRQWRFEPAHARSERGPLIKIQGKLTFYFVINDRGEARVENPKQFKSGKPSS